MEAGKERGYWEQVSGTSGFSGKFRLEVDSFDPTDGKPVRDSISMLHVSYDVGFLHIDIIKFVYNSVRSAHYFLGRNNLKTVFLIRIISDVLITLGYQGEKTTKSIKLSVVTSDLSPLNTLNVLHIFFVKGYFTTTFILYFRSR